MFIAILGLGLFVYNHDILSFIFLKFQVQDVALPNIHLSISL